MPGRRQEPLRVDPASCRPVAGKPATSTKGLSTRPPTPSRARPTPTHGLLRCRPTTGAGSGSTPRPARSRSGSTSRHGLAARPDIRAVHPGQVPLPARPAHHPRPGRHRHGRPTAHRCPQLVGQASPRYRSTAAGAYRLLATICNTAVADQVILRSPCRVKGGGNEKSPERPTASIAEVSAAVEAVPERFRLALMLAVVVPARRGEILGLQRRDIDELHGRLRDRARLRRPPRRHARHRAAQDRCQSAHGRYPRQRRRFVAEHMAKYVGPKPDAWLFPGENGQPITPRTLDRAWDKARRAAGRPGSPPTRPPPLRAHLVGRRRRHHSRADAPRRPCQPRRCPPLPARHRRPGPCSGRCPGRAIAGCASERSGQGRRRSRRWSGNHELMSLGSNRTKCPTLR